MGVPVAVTVNDPAVPATNVTLLALVIAGAWLTVMLSAFVALCGPPMLVSVTLTVKFDVPTVVGVPLITPALLNVSPAGREPVKVKVSVPAPPVAATVWL